MKKILFYLACPIISIVFTTVVVFSDLVIPTHKAEAGAFATELTQKIIASFSAAIAGSTAVTAGNTTALMLKDMTLDSIGWALAKQVVSVMIRSLINWVNSGFQGSPAFLQDLKQHLLGIADRAAGEFIKSLGGIGEFICSPFRLDVQVALSQSYARARTNMPSGPTEGMCTLSGIESNIEKFLSGTVESMDQWLKVTSNPQNTPYGAILEAQNKLNITLRNAAGQEIKMLEFNQGFLSRKVCEGVNGTPSAEGQNCKITTPGQVIAAQLNKALGAGQDALIEADEINELIGALMNQLLTKALQGVNGLLGLGGNSSYTDPSIANGENSFLDAMVKEASLIGIDDGTICRLIDTQGKIESTFIQMAEFITSSTTNPADGAVDADVDSALLDAQKNTILAEGNLGLLDEFVKRLSIPDTYATATKTPAIVQREVIVQYTQLQQAEVFTNQNTLGSKRAAWNHLFPALKNVELVPVLPWGECKADVLTINSSSSTSSEED